MNDTVDVNKQEKVFVTYYLIKLIATDLCDAILLNLFILFIF